MVANRSPGVLGEWCHAWTQRFALLYRAHAALRAAMTQGPGSDSESQAVARESALARYHRAFDNIDAVRILQTAQASQLHPAAAKVIATLNNEREGLARQLPTGRIRIPASRVHRLLTSRLRLPPGAG